MARRLTRKEMKHDEFVETAWEAGAWLEENWQTAAKVAAAVVVVGAIALFWWWYTTNSKAQAADLLAEGIAAYGEAAADDFADTAGVEAALQIFEQSIDKAESSPAGRSASYYRGVALIQLGRVDEAIEALEELTSKDLPPTLAANTRVILADALASSGQAERAMTLLQEIADDPDAFYPPDQALLSLGKIHMQLGNVEQAREVWQRITEEYPRTAGAIEANQLLVTP
jgi:tetratricopeptide (TPR) repeat protein